MLTDGRGIVFLKDLRARGDVTSVIILTALDQVSDRIKGLNAGADDYLVKPFDPAEFSARVGSVARRYTGNPNPISSHGPLDIDLAARSVHHDGKPVQLTARFKRAGASAEGSGSPLVLASLRPMMSSGFQAPVRLPTEVSVTFSRTSSTT